MYLSIKSWLPFRARLSSSSVCFLLLLLRSSAFQAVVHLIIPVLERLPKGTPPPPDHTFFGGAKPTQSFHHRKMKDASPRMRKTVISIGFLFSRHSFLYSSLSILPPPSQRVKVPGKRRAFRGQPPLDPFSIGFYNEANKVTRASIKPSSTSSSPFLYPPTFFNLQVTCSC